MEAKRCPYFMEKFITRNRKLWLFFLIVILINSCEKTVAEPAPIQTEAFEAEKINTPENVLSDAEPVNEERIQESIAVPVLQPAIEEIPADNLDPLIADFLSESFQNDDYVLWEPPLDVKYREIHIAVHYTRENQNTFYNKIFDKAVGFEITDEGIIPYLYVRDFQFFDKDGTVFIDFSEGYRGIFGFDFSYSYPRGIAADVYPPGLTVGGFFDMGNRAADTFGIYWNENDKAGDALRQDRKGNTGKRDGRPKQADKGGSL